MEIDLLGRFAVRRDGRTLDDAEFGGRRVRQLVRLLAAERGHVVSRDLLIEALWGKQLPADPAANLNVVVNRARRALPDAIDTAGGGYVLRPGADVIVDAEQFERLVRQARDAQAHGDVTGAAAAARAALDLWREPLPEDAYSDWARPHRERLDRLHQDALEIAAAAALAAGDPRGAADLAAAAVARQPLREAAHVLRIRALAADGDQAAAVAAYLDLRRLLADELGIDPSAEATALYEQLLRGTVPTRARSTRSDLPPLVGRDAELDRLTELGGDRRIAVVSGRSGWGKSRLLEALCARSDRPVLLARALRPEREEPWSLARTLLGDLLPDPDAADLTIEAKSRRALIQQRIVRAVEGTAPSLVVVDDLQWADSSSLDVLAHLVGRRSDVHLVVAYRPEEVIEDSPVSAFVALVAEADPVEIALSPLAADALRGLVASDSVAAALAEHTDGTPFAVLQAVRTLEREGLLRRLPSGAWAVAAEPTPERVREVAHAGKRDAVWRQFERQPRAGRDLVACLALLGRPVPARLLSAACEMAVDDAMHALQDLARNHLVRHDAEGFRVDHDLVGETIRDRLDPVGRARLHHRLARALQHTDGPVDELARHLTGAGDTAAAATAFATAAKARLDRFADSEARQLAAEGLALDPAVDVRTVLLEVRAETAARQGDLTGARDDLRAALRDAASRPVRARLLTRLAELTAGSEDLLRASELADLALAEAGHDPPARARALYVRALLDMNLGHQARADARFDEALALFSEIGDAAGMADILDARAMTAFGNGEITVGIAEFDRVAKLFADSGNLLRVVTPQSTRGHGLVFAGRPEEGLAEIDAALDLARNLGYAEGEAMALWHRAEALVALDRPEDALDAAVAGLAIAQRLGHRGWTATTQRAVGIARAALGDLDGAAAAFEESLRTSGEHLIMFRCWGHARLAGVRLAQGRDESAAAHVREALAVGPELAQYEARLAQCELAVHRGEPDAAVLVENARDRAVAGGHIVSAVRLAELHC